MYKVQHTLDDEIIREFKNESEFIAFGKIIAEENGDSVDVPMLNNVENVAVYIENYCDNFKLLTPVTQEQVIDEMVNNPSYKDNLKEILEFYFKDRPYAYDGVEGWKQWFLGMQGK